jgi:hypothetical protein
MVPRRFRNLLLGPSEKVIGRHKIRFHLDDLVHFQRVEVGKAIHYHWFCKMAAANGNRWQPANVACDEVGLYHMTMHEAEEAALKHICNEHRGVGGQKRRKRET